MQYIKTNSENKDFQKLVAELDADLKIRDGDDHAFFAQYNKIDNINHVVVFYENEIAIGCGALKEFASDVMEIKRMYVVPSKRGQGTASFILSELESWAAAMNYKTAILETGIKQPEAIKLYTKNNYKVIPNYGQYKGVAESVCFEKAL